MTRLTPRTLLVAAIILLAGMPARAQIVNGSFESVPTNLDPIPGWKLVVSGANCLSTWGIAKTGDTLLKGGGTLLPSGIPVPGGCKEWSAGLPVTFTATHGTQLAYQFQNGGGMYVHRMHQDITLPLTQPSTLHWDMQYRNHRVEGFDLAIHYLAVRIRDSVSDAILETLFITNPGAPQSTLSTTMPHYFKDLAAYAGRTVRLSVEIQVSNNFLDAQFDNFTLVANPPVAPVGQDGELGQHGELGHHEEPGSTDRK